MASVIHKIPMDKAGRVVIPQEIRKHFGIQGGAEFKVVETPTAILLEPIEEEPRLVMKNGLLVVVGGEILEQDVDLIARSREERFRKLVDPT